MPNNTNNVKRRTLEKSKTSRYQEMLREKREARSVLYVGK